GQGGDAHLFCDVSLFDAVVGVVVEGDKIQILKETVLELPELRLKTALLQELPSLFDQHMTGQFIGHAVRPDQFSTAELPDNGGEAEEELLGEQRIVVELIAWRKHRAD